MLLTLSDTSVCPQVTASKIRDRLGQILYGRLTVYLSLCLREQIKIA